MQALSQNQNQNNPKTLKRVKGGVTSDAQSTTPPSAQYNAPKPPAPIQPTAPTINAPTTPSIQGAGTPQPTTSGQPTGAPSGQYTAPQQTGMGLPTAPENPMGDMAMAARPMAARPMAPSQPLERGTAPPLDEDTQNTMDLIAQQEQMQDSTRGPTGPYQPTIDDYITPETYTPDNFADTLAEGETVPAMDRDAPMGTDRNRQIVQAYQPMVEAGGFADYDEYAEAANALGDTEVTQGQFTGYKTNKAFQESEYYSAVNNSIESSNRDIDLLTNRLVGQARIDAQRAGYAPGSREYNSMIRNATDMASQESVRIRQAAGDQYTRQLDKYLDREESKDRRLEERDYQETQQRDKSYKDILANSPVAKATYEQARGAGMSPEKAYQSLLDTEGNMKPKYVHSPIQQDIAARKEELRLLFPNMTDSEVNERATEEAREEYEQSRTKIEADIVTQNAKTAREDLLANITYAKDTDGVSSPEYLSALEQLTPQQINDLKTNPTTRTELEAAGIQLDVNFEAMGLDAGDNPDTIAKKAGITPAVTVSTRGGEVTRNFAKGDVSYIEKDGDIFEVSSIQRKRVRDDKMVFGVVVKTGEDDITNKIIGYNVRTGQEEILWEGSKG